MSIITAPHPTLRKKTAPVTKVDKKLLQNIDLLREDLLAEKDPEGVGLAFPQINKSIRAFAYRKNTRIKKKNDIQVFFNPEIISHSQEQILGRKPDKPDYEGCLSVPNLWGQVPRWSWIELKYELIENGHFSAHQAKFDNYASRAIQHELDHLDGILFTDHILEHDLPIYLEQNGEWVEFNDKELLRTF